MNRRIFSFVLAVLLTFSVLVIPKSESFAADTTSRKIWQTGASGQEFSFAWEAVSGADHYNVKIKIKSGSSETVKYNKSVTATSLTLKKATPGVEYRVDIDSVDAEGNISSYIKDKKVYSAPRKPNNLQLERWEDDDGKVEAYIVWTGYNSSVKGYYVPDGYQIQITSLAGKKITTKTVKSPKLTLTISTGFNAKVRTFRLAVDKNGKKTKKLYGGWTEVQAFIPQAIIYKATAVTNNNKKAKIYWKKVDHAVGYTVYEVKDAKGGKKKLSPIATIKNGNTLYAEVPRGVSLCVFPKVKVGAKVYECTAQSKQEKFKTITIP